MKTEFRKYTCDDFILDDDFRRIVSSPAFSGELIELIQALPEKEEEILLAQEILLHLETPPIRQSEERKQELWNQIVHASRKKYSLLPFLRIAAIFILLAGITTVFNFQSKHPEKEQIVQKSEQPLSTNDAQLILANGKTVRISAQQSTVHVTADGSRILVNDSSKLVNPALVGDNQLIVPYGKRSKIILADGSKVWINSGSKLTFPPAFKGTSREVSLEGEALFEVTKDPEKPFYVKTSAFKVKVYGTRFNVQAYQQDQQNNVVLVEGKISMNLNGTTGKEVFLDPNQKASVTKGESTLQVQNITDADLYTAWTEGYLVFRNEGVKEVLHRVSRYYNVPIETEDPSNMDKICGKLDLKEDVERVLKGIAFISKTKYIKQDEKYIFKSEPIKN
jgi:hypothetical protein